MPATFGNSKAWWRLTVLMMLPSSLAFVPLGVSNFNSKSSAVKAFLRPERMPDRKISFPRSGTGLYRNSPEWPSRSSGLTTVWAYTGGKPKPLKPNAVITAERYSSADWLRSLLSLPKSNLLRRVSSQLFGNTLFSACVWAAYVIWPEYVKILTVGLNSQHMLLVGNALALLLVFRTNTAYDRFWEARRMWGFLISRIREVVFATFRRAADRLS
jgi:hypothetical protein